MWKPEHPGGRDDSYMDCFVAWHLRIRMYKSFNSRLNAF